MFYLVGVEMPDSTPPKPDKEQAVAVSSALSIGLIRLTPRVDTEAFCLMKVLTPALILWG